MASLPQRYGVLPQFLAPEGIKGEALSGRSRLVGSFCVLLVVRRVPLGDGVNDDLGRDRSRLSEVRITNHLLLNALALGL
jgi:hypothetical protein